MTAGRSDTWPRPAGAHGGDGSRLARALGVPPAAVLDLSASLNPRGTRSRTRCWPATSTPSAAIPIPARRPRRWPRAIGVEPERLLLTNGGAEAIALVAAELGAGWVDEPEFSLYRRHLPALDPGAGRWRSNPHNPTGLLAGPDATASVWDEAFWPLATGTWTRGDAEVGAVVIGSLTKLLACPGSADRLRARPERRVHRPPGWSDASRSGPSTAWPPPPSPNCSTPVDLPAWAASNGQPSATTWSPPSGRPATSRRRRRPTGCSSRAPDLRERLAAEAICVRDCASFGLPGTVRIAVPDAAGLVRLRRAL